jgi:hypothetical protein
MTKTAALFSGLNCPKFDVVAYILPKRNDNIIGKQIFVLSNRISMIKCGKTIAFRLLKQ